jgi:hypothetical protein
LGGFASSEVISRTRSSARAAWLLGGYASTASHLGQIAQKRDKLADALSFYLTAQALTPRPTPEMIDRVKRLAGGGDLKLMVETARRMAPSDRLIRLTPKPPASPPVMSANFLVILDDQLEALEVRFEDGSDALRSMEGALCSAKYPLNIPGTVRPRLAVGVKIGCDAQQVCVGLVDYPGHVKLKH